ncbi:MAG: OmpH family outer membrane protein [candidate division WOR-3 bacterium]
MKHRILFLISIILSTTAFAKDAKIGYVNLKYLLENYETAQSAQRTLDLEVMRYKMIADSLKRNYEALEAALASQRLILSEAAIRAKEIEINEAKRQYDVYVEEIWGKGGKFERKNKELIAPIMQEIKNVCADIAKKEGFVLIIDISQTPVLYAQSGLDLTEKILSELKARAGVISSQAAQSKTATVDTSPAVVREIKIAVLPFFNENRESQQENIGAQIQQAIIDIIKTFPQTQIIAKGEINNALLSRNITSTSEINDADALSIGLMLNAKYVVFGSNRKEGNLIRVTIKVLDPEKNEQITDMELEITRKELLKQELGEAVKRFLKIVEKK